MIETQCTDLEHDIEFIYVMASMTPSSFATYYYFNNITQKITTGGKEQFPTLYDCLKNAQSRGKFDNNKWSQYDDSLPLVSKIIENIMAQKDGCISFCTRLLNEDGLWNPYTGSCAYYITLGAYNTYIFAWDENLHKALYKAILKFAEAYIKLEEQ